MKRSKYIDLKALEEEFLLENDLDPKNIDLDKFYESIRLLYEGGSKAEKEPLENISVWDETSTNECIEYEVKIDDYPIDLDLIIERKDIGKEGSFSLESTSYISMRYNCPIACAALRQSDLSKYFGKGMAGVLTHYSYTAVAFFLLKYLTRDRSYHEFKCNQGGFDMSDGVTIFIECQLGKIDAKLLIASLANYSNSVLHEKDGDRQFTSTNGVRVHSNKDRNVIVLSKIRQQVG